MEENVVDLKKFEKEQKRRERKERRKAQFQRVILWCSENKELAMIIIPAGLGLFGFLVKGTITITKGLIRTINLNKEQALQQKTCYDRSLGHYWELKRKLTNAEWIAIDQRRKNGERLSEILYDLGVLAA